MSTQNAQSYQQAIKGNKYTQSFKITVVSEVLSGQINAAGALKKYGIAGHSTIAKWIKKYGYNKELRQFRKVVMPTEKMKVKELQKRIHQLEGLVSDLQLEKKSLNKIIEIAEREYQISIKKNFGQKPLTNLPSRKED